MTDFPPLIALALQKAGAIEPAFLFVLRKERESQFSPAISEPSFPKSCQAA